MTSLPSHAEALLKGEGWVHPIKRLVETVSKPCKNVRKFRRGSLVVRTISLKLLYGSVILRHARWRLVTISVTTNPTVRWFAGQVTDALPSDETPPASRRNIRRSLYQPHSYKGETAPRSPCQNGHVERLIGSIRRESLDHLIVCDEAQLRRILKNHAS
jgi:hypothetical protein